MGAGKSLCILVAEDDFDTREVLARLLRLSGHVVHTATTAAEALALADAHKCDLLISDIGLPDRSGIELMRELRERHGLKGIAISGYATRQDVEAALAAGFDRHLAKPASLSALLAAIDEITR